MTCGETVEQCPTESWYMLDIWSFPVKCCHGLQMLHPPKSWRKTEYCQQDAAAPSHAKYRMRIDKIFRAGQKTPAPAPAASHRPPQNYTLNVYVLFFCLFVFLPDSLQVNFHPSPEQLSLKCIYTCLKKRIIKMKDGYHAHIKWDVVFKCRTYFLSKGGAVCLINTLAY